VACCQGRLRKIDAHSAANPGDEPNSFALLVSALRFKGERGPHAGDEDQQLLRAE
jgi:hypothetical protein